jgi:ATP-dependent Clp protease protease subunit
MATPTQPLLSLDAYGVFCGQIDQAALQRIFQNLSLATNPALNIKSVHLLFQSSGGFVGDGVCLYNFFRSFPVDLTLYNVGSVLSIATIAYLGAKTRKASARAMFGIHRSIMTPQAATSADLPPENWSKGNVSSRV